jgi:hypothetical protein
MAVTKFQILLNDLLIKHKVSILLYDEICHLFKQYISFYNFDRFAKFKSRRLLLNSTQKTHNSKALRPINGTVRLHDNSLVTVPVFDTHSLKCMNITGRYERKTGRRRTVVNFE